MRIRGSIHSQITTTGRLVEQDAQRQTSVRVNNKAIQRKLLVERDLTYERDLAIAQESEEADKNLRTLKAVKYNKL